MFTVHFVDSGIFLFYLVFGVRRKTPNDGVWFLRPRLYSFQKDMRREFSLEVILINKLPRFTKIKYLSQGQFTSKWQSKDMKSEWPCSRSGIHLHVTFFSILINHLYLDDVLILESPHYFLYSQTRSSFFF